MSNVSLSDGKRKGALIRVFVLQVIIQGLASEGDRLNALLKQHNISDARLGNPYATVDLTDYLGFFEDAAVTFSDPVLGARLGMNLRPGDFWPIGLVLMQAGSISSALAHFCRYAPAFQTGSSFSMQSSAEGLVCSYDVHGDLLDQELFRQDNEFTLACICSQIRTAFDKKWKPLEVRFRHGSNGRERLLERMFEAPVHFGQARNCIVVDPSEAERQHRNEDRELIGILNQHLGSLVVANNSELSMTEQVQALIHVKLGISSVAIPDLAKEMRMTARSLQRRLEEEGTSVREILQAHRKRMAENYLSRGDMSMEEISNALGYAEPLIFARAFKSWTGRNPVRRQGSRY
ncbi:AraC family transcriptional regulator [Agrobacterium leguminum]|uniref:AraC family transcriptional regulator n=1 Tax=Agrobacterium leguminum TaxID=2792015 RepID=A0A9X3QVE6_9HYPH|nr:AraC family transcriptional regulator [Agrobacterium leguminum]MCZ7911484.1 AraC family transcriptional regulator [Agrobacterium leguminum]